MYLVGFFVFGVAVSRYRIKKDIFNISFDRFWDLLLRFGDLGSSIWAVCLDTYFLFQLLFLDNPQ